MKARYIYIGNRWAHIRIVDAPNPKSESVYENVIHLLYKVSIVEREDEYTEYGR